jgi:hypothetical protein
MTSNQSSSPPSSSYRHGHIKECASSKHRHIIAASSKELAKTILAEGLEEESIFPMAIPFSLPLISFNVICPGGQISGRASCSILT